MQLIVYDKSGKYSTAWAYDILQDKKGRIWMGSYQGGVFVMDKAALLSGKAIADWHYSDKGKNALSGALYLAIVAILPIIVGKIIGDSTLAIGGTSVIIVVGVALETVKAMEAQMLMRHYKGFLE